MKYKKIILCFLFITLKTSCMLSSDISFFIPHISRKHLPNDVTQLIIHQNDFRTNTCFIRTCTYLYHTYNKPELLLSQHPLEDKFYIQAMMFFSKKNTAIFQHLIDYEGEENKKNRLEILQTFTIENTIDNNLKIYNTEQIKDLTKNITYDKNNLYLIKQFLPKVSLNAQDQYGNTPLHDAIRNNNIDAMKPLLTDKQVNPNILNKDFNSAYSSHCTTCEKTSWTYHTSPCATEKILSKHTSFFYKYLGKIVSITLKATILIVFATIKKICSG